jgi:hypothetical protein
MLGSIFSSIGNFVGNIFGGGVLSSAGRFIGKWIGDSLEDDEDNIHETCRIGRVKNKLYPISNANGQIIPLVFGTSRVEGRIIWAESIIEVPVKEVVTRVFSKSTRIHGKVEFYYYCNFAVAICAGEISSVLRVWANLELIDLQNYKYRIYNGSEDQMPDPKISENHGADDTPAFRGLCYIVFEDFPLVDFGNNIPRFSFEVVRKPSVDSSNKLENKIKGVNIIPGSGEFVYDTIIQTKKVLQDSFVIAEHKINSNNAKNIADSIYSIDYLKELCPKVKWLSVVVCWFGDYLDIGRCEIYPAVENPPLESAEFSEEWRVGKYTRHTARVISKSDGITPNYGGTINDASLIRYLEELKSRGFKIILYPMILMDIEGKPWRGKLSGDVSKVEEFFRKDNGYNNFIIHYTDLCRGLYDAIIIGSEFRSLTELKEGERFPAVGELIHLSYIVKSKVGRDVKVSYAADWSEYHHTSGGWYHLDDLWASDSIDFIGIDNYMPLTDSRSTSPTYDEIYKGFSSGEGYEYYLDGDDKKKLDAPYAWKNLRWWWENEHINPNGMRTSWVPRSKKIWFTEYGFPSIDKATNQPNIFYDPKCVDGGAPKYSNKSVDNAIQRRGIEAFIDFWSREEYVEQMFLWCFDARPYPQWPHAKIWGDYYLWSRGHWINGKLGGVFLSDVLTEVSKECEIEENLSFLGTDHIIFDIAIKSRITAIEFINILRCSYFFSMTGNTDGGIEFINYLSGNEFRMNKTDVIDVNYLDAYEENLAKDFVVSNLSIRFISFEEEYNESFCSARSDEFNGLYKEIRFPYIMNLEDAKRVGNIIIEQSNSTKKIYNLNLPLDYIFIKVGDKIRLVSDDSEHVVRILFLKLENDYLNVVGTDIEKIDLEVCLSSNVGIIEDNSGSVEFIRAENSDSVYPSKILIFINNSKSQKALSISSDGKYFEKIQDLKPNIPNGKIINVLIAEIRNEVIVGGYIDVYVDINSIKKERDLRNLTSGVVIQNKIIFIGSVIKLSKNIFRLCEIIFPVSDSEYPIKIGDNITFLDKAVYIDAPNLGMDTIFYRGKDGITEVLY